MGWAARRRDLCPKYVEFLSGRKLHSMTLFTNDLGDNPKDLRSEILRQG